MSCGSLGTDNQSGEIKDNSSLSKDTRSILIPDTTMASNAKAREVMFKDSIVLWDTKEFKPIKTKLANLTWKKYQEMLQQLNKECASDTGDFLSSKGLRYHQTCDEVCTSFLTDLKNGVRMVVPSNYDGGLRGMVVSPKCSRLAFYSSYDGIDYSDYYEYCSEIFFYQLHEGNGIQTLTPESVYFTKAFTITEMFWINEKTIILKTYAEDRHQVSEDKLTYQYYQAILP
jgi:hypothetical protein